MKKFCVTYSYTIFADATVEADNKRLARKKVEEVVGPVKIDDVWEIKPIVFGGEKCESKRT